MCDLSDVDSECPDISLSLSPTRGHHPLSPPTPTIPISVGALGESQGKFRTSTPSPLRPAHMDFNMNAAAGTAAELSAAAERFITQQLSAVPAELELKSSGVGFGMGVYVKQSVSRGIRYGPFLGKWTIRAKDPNLAWEVSIYFFACLFF